MYLEYVQVDAIICEVYSSGSTYESID